MTVARDMGDTGSGTCLTLSLVLRELSVVEQRYQAVLAVIAEGHSVVEVASRWGVSRQTVHGWLRRYEDAGLDGLKDRSRRPVSSPWQMSAAVEAAVLEWRRTHPSWGPRRLAHEAVKAGLSPVPSRSGIYRALLRAGLIDPEARRDHYVIGVGDVQHLITWRVAAISRRAPRISPL